MRRISTALVVIGILLLPAAASAADWLPIVQCGGPGQNSCTPCDLFATVKRMFDFVLYGVTGPVAAFMVVLAGGMMLIGGANPKYYSQGKTMLTNTLIGVTIILLAWLVTTFLVKSLIRTGQGDRWYEFSCPESLAQDVRPIETAPVTGSGPEIPAVDYQPAYLGVYTGGQGSGGAGGAGGTAYAANPLCEVGTCPGNGGKCPAFEQLFRGRSNSRMLEYIAWHESGCKPNIQGKTGDYGLMQLTPATANANRQGCDVTETRKDANGTETTVDVQVTGAWLSSEQNIEKVICIADNYLNSLKGSCGTDPYHLIAGYNGGAGACAPSRDCPDVPACQGSGPMRVFECPWDNRAHTEENTGYRVTRLYAAEAAACLR